MFDIGFWEVIFILVIALLVVGPERLPRVARTAGLWLGKIRGFVGSVKADIDRELAAEELKKTLARQAAVPELEEIIEKTTDKLSGDNSSVAASDKPVTDNSGTASSSTHEKQEMNAAQKFPSSEEPDEKRS
jgi:sec-independent protein translocase protein TatB